LSEVFKLAIVKNDLTRARQALHKRDFHASLFEGVTKRTQCFCKLPPTLRSGKRSIEVVTISQCQPVPSPDLQE
jgi:hypothetical protein